jgi:hypothetical protein
MGIKCSLLGHRFAETEVTEEREEQGSEVVVTIREIERCDRCGAERVVSENKEVTSLETAEAAAEDTDDEPDVETTAGPSPSTGTDPTPDMDAAEDEAVILDDEDDEAESPAAPAEPDDAGTGTEPASGSTAETTEPDEPEPTAAEDDAVILDDEDDEPERDPGEWPDEADEPAATEDDPGEPDAGSPGESWPDEADSGPAEGDRAAEEVAWPDEGDDGDDDEWEPSESLTQKIDQGEVEPAGSATVTVPEGEFHCPECEFVTSVESTSLRAGDFCPECHRGSLEHVPEGETRKE